ncbi:hypothetical protein DRQ53_12700 [bacterium]|nr:MAG: hypothetical protein DRQ53_12700 [bacterium]
MKNVVTHLRKLRACEHRCTVEIIESLVVCHREHAYLDHGCSSIWNFLVEELHYSKAAASRRFKAMKCAEKFPQVIGMLRDHRVSLSSLAQAEGLLGEVNDPGELLGRISGKSAVEVEKIVAGERPMPSKPREVVRRVAVRRGVSQGTIAARKNSKASSGSLFDTSLAASPAASAPHDDSAPIESRVSLRTSLTEEAYDSFEHARALISRKRPGATVEDAVNELVGFYLKSKVPKDRTKRSTKGADEGSPAPRPKRGSLSTRHIPAATRDAVLLRDGERCAFVGKNGRRCTATHNLQLDHIRPFALGGSHEPDNLQVLCAAHNRHRARQTFGEQAVRAREQPAIQCADPPTRRPVGPQNPLIPPRTEA